MEALEVKNVSKTYGDNKAVDDVSFSIREGEMFSLLGPNGSGKTTLISMITNLIPMDAGEIKVFGETVDEKNLEARRNFGLVPQEIINHGFFTVNEILGFVSGYYGLYDNRERIDFLLENLGLTEHRHKLVSQLSGGMKRRLLIAKALVHRPKLILLDEPTAGVDIELRNSMWEFIRRLNKEEKLAVLLTTHYLEEAEELCDRVAIIRKGKLLKTGATKELVSELTLKQVILKLCKEVDLKSDFLTAKKDLEYTFQLPNHMHVGELLNSLQMDNSCIEDIIIREGKLEDAFLNVVSGENYGS